MAETVTRKRPIRGAVWGFLLGLGVALLLTVAWPVIALESVSQVVTQWVIVIVIVMVLSVLWGMFGPAKKPKGPPPQQASVAAERVAATMEPVEPEQPMDDAGDGGAMEEDTGA